MPGMIEWDTKKLDRHSSSVGCVWDSSRNMREIQFEYFFFLAREKNKTRKIDEEVQLCIIKFARQNRLESPSSDENDSISYVRNSAELCLYRERRNNTSYEIANKVSKVVNFESFEAFSSSSSTSGAECKNRVNNGGEVGKRTQDRVLCVVDQQYPAQHYSDARSRAPKT